MPCHSSNHLPTPFSLVRRCQCKGPIERNLPFAHPYLLSAAAVRENWFSSLAKHSAILREHSPGVNSEFLQVLDRFWASNVGGGAGTRAPEAGQAKRPGGAE